MTVAIIDYGSGNLHSAAKASKRCAHARAAGKILVTSDPEKSGVRPRRAPGVGAFADCKRARRASTAWQALNETINKARPFGICVGMHWMAEHGREYETVDGLGWIKGVVEDHARTSA